VYHTTTVSKQDYQYYNLTPGFLWPASYSFTIIIIIMKTYKAPLTWGSAAPYSTMSISYSKKTNSNMLKTNKSSSSMHFHPIMLILS